MSEQIREQVSAFLDGELPNSETELLLKRLMRDGELRGGFGRYALIGEAMRGDGTARLSHDFTARVNRSIDGEPAVTGPQVARSRPARWWRPLAGTAVAAGVATVAVLALQQRAVAPGLHGGALLDARNGVAIKAREPISYTVPAPVVEQVTALPAARLTNYVFAHSRYSSALGKESVLSDLLTATDDEDMPAAGRASKGEHDGTP